MESPNRNSKINTANTCKNTNETNKKNKQTVETNNQLFIYSLDQPLIFHLVLLYFLLSFSNLLFLSVLCGFAFETFCKKCDVL